MRRGCLCHIYGFKNSYGERQLWPNIRPQVDINTCWCLCVTIHTVCLVSLFDCICVFKRFETTCLASFTLPKIHFARECKRSETGGLKPLKNYKSSESQFL